MNIKIKPYIIFVFISVLILYLFFDTQKVYADDFSKAVDEQLEELDLSDLENYFNESEMGSYGFSETIKNILAGNYSFDYDGLTGYIKDIIFGNLTKLLPVIAGILFITFICFLVKNLRSNTLGEGVSDIVKFACLSSIVILSSGEFYIIWNTTKNTIENLTKFNEIMSPIILTLMVASGGTVSAGIYKPTVLFLTTGIINLFYSIILPLIGIITMINVLSAFSSAVKLKKFSEFLTGLLKWMFGIVITVYGFFITVQGISAASFDGISFKVAKYAVGNGIPIVGSLIKDGFDVVVAGSLLIKNSVGIAGVIGLFYILLSPVLFLAAFSLLLKLSSAITSVFDDGYVSDFLTNVSKSVTYFNVCIISVAFMTFITILLMTFSVNSVI